MSLSDEWAWERIDDNIDFYTWRMKVPGGWLIKTTDNKDYYAITSTIIFVREVQ